MYDYFKGLITYISPSYIVLEVNGIGYSILAVNPFSYEEGKEATVYVYQAVREDSQQLFGFNTREEKEIFLRLISVSGIGPKSALGILAGKDHQGLLEAIEREDVKYLTKFPGVGKKTAQQIILDLKGKLSFNESDTPRKNAPKEEALEALKALGYSEKEVNSLKDQLTEGKSTEEYISLGLKLLLKK